MNATQNRSADHGATEVRHASYVIDALCDLLRAASGEPVSSISVLTLLEPVRDELHQAYDAIGRVQKPRIK